MAVIVRVYPGPVLLGPVVLAEMPIPIWSKNCSARTDLQRGTDATANHTQLNLTHVSTSIVRFAMCALLTTTWIGEMTA